jgi:TolB-like protein/tetratricopeptide (TPR) repeat protein
MTAPRKLAAILAADIAGYSRLMGADDEGTLAQLKAHRQNLIDPKITEHHGRMVNTTGDGMLVEFASVVDAVRCAVDVQQGMAERNSEVPKDRQIEFRVGIHQGDIIIDGADIFGDGVNVAARLEGLAEAGGICVSGRVQEDARGKIDLPFDDAGEQQLKNIDRPVRVFRVRLGGAARPKLALHLPDKPSIAVLPFQNMSGDPEQEYFADGVVEEIITALSRFRHLFVIARNSSFTYRGRAVDVKQVGRELGVRYVLEGSVRKAGNHVRITGQLVDATTAAHLWADRFDGGIDNIFDLQDRVTANVVGAIAPKLQQAEIERAKRKPTESLDAYDFLLRGVASVHQWSKEATAEALRLFYRAIDLDPDFASAYGMAAWCYTWRKVNGWMGAHEAAEAGRLAHRAAELGRDDAEALVFAGHTLARVVGDVESGAALIDRALALNPNLAAAWRCSGWTRIWLGQPEEATRHLATAMRLSPVDPFIHHMQSATALAYFFIDRYDKASEWAEKALQVQPNYMPAARIAAISNALAGRLDQAHKMMARTRQLDPELRVSNISDRLPFFRRPADLAKYKEALRIAGLPE